MQSLEHNKRLRQVARRPIDLPVRLGGEEFATLTPLPEPAGARHCAQRASEAVQALAIAHGGNEAFGGLTVSARLTPPARRRRAARIWGHFGHQPAWLLRRELLF